MSRKEPPFYQGREGTPEHHAWELNSYIERVKSMPEFHPYIGDELITKMFRRACEEYDYFSYIIKATDLMIWSYMQANIDK